MKNQCNQESFETFAQMMRIFTLLFGSLGLCLYICLAHEQLVGSAGAAALEGLSGDIYIPAGIITVEACVIGGIGAFFGVFAGAASLVDVKGARCQCGSMVFSFFSFIFSVIAMSMLVLALRPFLLIFTAIVLTVLPPPFSL